MLLLSRLIQNSWSSSLTSILWVKFLCCFVRQFEGKRLNVKDFVGLTNTERNWNSKWKKNWLNKIFCEIISIHRFERVKFSLFQIKSDLENFTPSNIVEIFKWNFICGNIDGIQIHAILFYRCVYGGINGTYKSSNNTSTSK